MNQELNIPFYKYHGTGNDFIIIDQSQQTIFDDSNTALVASMCHRRFGIGADGLMLLNPSTELGIDFEMIYYNSDGNISSMCGNGGRCISHLAYQLGLGSKEMVFKFKHDIYHATYHEDTDQVSLKMQDLCLVDRDEDAYVLDTGSPHYVSFVESINSIDINEEGARIRNSDKYKNEGINVNFCEWTNEVLAVKTFERGVEAETYSCGTGVVASAIAHIENNNYNLGKHLLEIKTKGGELKVSLTKELGKYKDIYLIGPAVCNFTGNWKER